MQVAAEAEAPVLPHLQTTVPPRTRSVREPTTTSRTTPELHPWAAAEYTVASEVRQTRSGTICKSEIQET